MVVDEELFLDKLNRWQISRPVPEIPDHSLGVVMSTSLEKDYAFLAYAPLICTLVQLSTYRYSCFTASAAPMSSVSVFAANNIALITGGASGNWDSARSCHFADSALQV